ncbi:hypothetical protein NOVOSPHI9U_10205 [Novosphingobium sp. 9U]|nr:hypothetical protein NOVOSPHI9U_10205 [Novosphingobium sp. 9U]
MGRDGHRRRGDARGWPRRPDPRQRTRIAHRLARLADAAVQAGTVRHRDVARARVRSDMALPAALQMIDTTLHEHGREYLAARNQARRQLIAERGDPTPHRLG